MSLLTVKAVAERVGLSEWAIRRAIHDGELAAYKPRGQLRVDVADLEHWLDGTRVAPTAQPPAAALSVTPSPAYPAGGSFRSRARRRETA